MAPAAKGKAAAAKRGRQADKSDKIDEPPKKKRPDRKTGNVPRPKDIITIEDDESVTKFVEPEPKTETGIRPMLKPVGDFPRFNNGDVIIELVQRNSKYSYQLHGSVLERASSWFAQILRPEMEEAEPDPHLAANHPIIGMLWARFDLRCGQELKIPELTRSVLTYVKKAEISPVLKQYAPSTATESEDDLNTEILPAPSPPRHQSMKSTDDVGMEETPELRVSGGADPRLGYRRALAVEKKPLEAESSIQAPPKVFEIDPVTEQPKHDEDIIMTNTGVVILDVAEVSGQTVRDVISVKKDRCATSVLDPIAEEQLSVKQKMFDDDSAMEEVSDTSTSEPTEGTAESQLPIQKVSSSSLSSVLAVEVPAAKKEESPGSKASQNAQVGITIKHKDTVARSPAEAVNKEPAIKQEKVDDDTIKAYGSDATAINTMETIGESHPKIVKDQVPMTGQDFTDTVSGPASEACAINEEECPDSVSATGPENPSVKQQETAVLISPRSVDEEAVIKQETSDIPVSTLEVEAELAIKEDGVTSASIQASKEELDNENERLAVPVCPGLDDASKVKQETSEVLTCTHVNKQKANIDEKHADLSICAEPTGGKKQENVVTVSHTQGNNEKPVLQEDGAGTFRLRGIPQGDGPSEHKASKGQVSTQPSNTIISRQWPSTKNIHHAPPGSAVVDKSTTNHIKSVSANNGEPAVLKSRYVSTRGTHKFPPVQDVVESAIGEEQSSTPSQAPDVQIAQAEKSKTAPVTVTNKPSIDVLRAYDNLFLTYYSRHPLIDNQDIGIALEQSELLINVARLYGSIPIVRPYINSALMHFGRELYMAVMADPPRWIRLSVYLESASIFQESIIHLVANHPYWPWPTLEPDEIFSSVAELLHKKLYAFEALKGSANKSLLSNEVRDVEVFSRAPNSDDFDTWFVVQYWKDWFTRSLAKANKASDVGQKCVRGKVYRDLGRSGEAYLPTILVLDAVEACRSKDLHAKSNRQGIERDLKALKDFAQKQVRELCANYSMLSVEDAGIDYLTCIKVEDNELPWVKSEGN